MNSRERNAFRAAVEIEKFRIRVNTEALAQIAREDAEAAEDLIHDAADLISVEPS